MINVKLIHYTWEELLHSFGDDTPITDEEFERLMAPTNFEVEEE